MAAHRPKVNQHVKAALYEQAGRKCANPGCPSILLELHHIREWHVYQTHDEAHMVALCATCHDHVDRGDLHISDDDLYHWKGIPRVTRPTAHLFVEPGPPPALLLGSICCRGDSGLTVFDLSGSLRLGFVVRDSDIMLLALRVSDLEDNLIVEVVDGYVRSQDPRIELEHRPGRVTARRVSTVKVMPTWAKLSLLAADARCRVEELPVLDLHVLEPGLVRIQGIWMERDKGVVITEDRLSFLHRDRPHPITIMGAGKKSVLHFAGPVSMSLFKLN